MDVVYVLSRIRSRGKSGRAIIKRLSRSFVLAELKKKAVEPMMTGKVDLTRIAFDRENFKSLAVLVYRSS